MGYCVHCGEKVSKEFCPRCGKRVGEENTQISNIQTVRNDSIKECNRIYNYFFQKKSQYDEYDRLNVLINKPMSAISVLLILMGAFFILGGLSCFLINEVFSVVLGLVLGSVIIVAVVINRKSKNEKRAERIKELSIELSDHYKRFGYCPIGAEFTNPDIIAVIANYLRQGRASNIQEALNLMFDDLHKQNMLQYAKYQSDMAAKAARGATAASVFCAGAFFIGLCRRY